MSAQAIMSTLCEHGITAQVLSGDVLRLTPASALTDGIREGVRAHKADILAELARMSNGVTEADTASESQADAVSEALCIPCVECGRKVVLRLCGVDGETSADTGQWFRVECRCGHEGYICERDYRRWKAKGGKKRQAG